jgi:hypothetical protein
MKGGSKILVMVCMENGAISIFRRYKIKGDKFDSQGIDTEDPLV